MPSFLEFSSFVFFSCGCIVGPFFEYADYINFIEIKGHYVDMPTGPLNGLVVTKLVIIKFISAVFCAAMNILINVQGFGIQKCGDADFADSGSIFWKIWFSVVAM